MWLLLVNLKDNIRTLFMKKKSHGQIKFSENHKIVPSKQNSVKGKLPRWNNGKC